MKNFKALSVGLRLALSLVVVTGCEKKAGAKSETSGSSGDKPMTIGFIYVGTKDDYGYNQAHHEGAEVVKKIPGVKVIEQEAAKRTELPGAESALSTAGGPDAA